MDGWESREGRSGLPGIHGYYWETPWALANDTAMGKKFIEPGVSGEKTNLVIGLRRGFDSIPRMPVNGPFLTEEEIRDIINWIDDGMPE